MSRKGAKGALSALAEPWYFAVEAFGWRPLLEEKDRMPQRRRKSPFGDFLVGSSRTADRRVPASRFCARIVRKGAKGALGALAETSYFAEEALGSKPFLKRLSTCSERRRMSPLATSFTNSTGTSETMKDSY